MKKLIIMGLILAVPSLGFMACKDRGEDGAKITDSANQMMQRELKTVFVEQCTLMFSLSAPSYAAKFSLRDEIYFFRVHFSAPC
jgi:hypothetical protein